MKSMVIHCTLLYSTVAVTFVSGLLGQCRGAKVMRRSASKRSGLCKLLEVCRNKKAAQNTDENTLCNTVSRLYSLSKSADRRAALRQHQVGTA